MGKYAEWEGMQSRGRSMQREGSMQSRGRSMQGRGGNMLSGEVSRVGKYAEQG